MKRKTLFGILFGFLALAAFVLLSYFVNNGDAESASRYSGTFMSLLPPVIAIGLALVTKKFIVLCLLVFWQAVCSVQTLRP